MEVLVKWTRNASWRQKGEFANKNLHHLPTKVMVAKVTSTYEVGEETIKRLWLFDLFTLW